MAAEGEGSAATRAAGRAGLLDRALASLSLLGGAALLGLGALVTASVLSRWLGLGGVPGDFELVQMLTAVSVFAFLPLCHVRRGHIFVDSFTGRLPAGARRGLDALWDACAAAAMGFVAWRLLAGAMDSLSSGTVTMVLGFPLGWAILACALLAGLAGVAALTAGLRMLAR